MNEYRAQKFETREESGFGETVRTDRGKLARQFDAIRNKGEDEVHFFPPFLFFFLTRSYGKRTFLVCCNL